MNKELIKLASNIAINEVRPRAKKHNNQFPPPDLFAEIVRMRHEDKITSKQVKIVLDTYYESIQTTT